MFKLYCKGSEKIESILRFLNFLKYTYQIRKIIPDNIGIVPDKIDLRSDEDKAIDLLDDVINYVKGLE